MIKTILGKNVQCPVKPAHINIGSHFYDAFGNVETEISARYIVSLCQERGDWLPFTHAEIEEFYRKKSPFRDFSFNRLIDDGWIFDVNGEYRVSLEFVARVWGSSPAI